MLVSHWSVFSDAARALTTEIFRALTAAPGIGRAEAHRRAMLTVMSTAELPHYAHPIFWAPFVVVGEGGATAD